MADAVADFPAASTTIESDAISTFSDRPEQAFQDLIAAYENEDLPHLMSEALKADPRAAGVARAPRSRLGQAVTRWQLAGVPAGLAKPTPEFGQLLL